MIAPAITPTVSVSPPQFSADSDAKPLIKAGNPLLTGGYISLQSESHPCEFRLVEILPLD